MGKDGEDASQYSISNRGSGIVQKLRSKTNDPNKSRKSSSKMQGAAFTTKPADEQDLRRKESDFETLLSNFQNGTTLKKLQKELAISKNSMKKSEGYLKDLSRDILGKM